MLRMFAGLQKLGPKADELDGSCSTGIERAKVQLSTVVSQTLN